MRIEGEGWKLAEAQAGHLGYPASWLLIGAKINYRVGFRPAGRCHLAALIDGVGIGEGEGRIVLLLGGLGTGGGFLLVRIWRREELTEGEAVGMSR